MTMTLDFLLNRSSAVLIIFALSAAAAGFVTKSPAWRTASGIAGVVAAFFIAISTRSLLEWTASAVERPSPPGLLLLVVLAIAAIMNRRPTASAEFRFGTLMLAVLGLVLYPAAVGFLNYDSYVLGYSGYLLPIAIAVILAYAIYRGISSRRWRSMRRSSRFWRARDKASISGTMSSIRSPGSSRPQRGLRSPFDFSSCEPAQKGIGPGLG